MIETIAKMKAYHERELQEARIDNMVGMARSVGHFSFTTRYLKNELKKLYKNKKKFEIVEAFFADVEAKRTEGIKV